MIFAAVFLLLGVLPVALAQGDDRLAVLQTPSGNIVIEFFPDDAPNHVDNFIRLAGNGFYDGTVFHRVIKDFMIQGGDPLTKPGAYETVSQWGTGDPGYSVDAEFNDIKHNRGIVSMARSANPDSAGSQFFIVHGDSNFLDEQYTVFGRIVTQESFETLDKIASLEIAQGANIPLDWGQGEITSASIVDRDSIEDLLELEDPERIVRPAIVEGGPYTHETLGLSLDVPAGWTLQAPETEDQSIPDIILLGPSTGTNTPVISITAEQKDGVTLDDKISQSNEVLQTAIDAGRLELISEEKITVNGIGMFERTIKGTFGIGTTANLMLKETIVDFADKFYIVTYVNEEGGFEDSLDLFDDTVRSFSTESQSLAPKEGCLIATAAYGSELAPQVQLLREIRDNTLLSTESGTSFMAGFSQVYYSFSPAIADLERQNPAFREAVKLFITPMLATLSVMTLAEEGSESQVLALGISVIALNLGMYVAAPAVIINRLRK